MAKKILQIVGAKKIEGSKKAFWTRIGTAFENADGSLNLSFDYFPTTPEITLQVREVDKK
ncbi:MAG: hypothetical protein KKA54_11025 [Proteobacteria bacterium]|nr:hypothetical protein [Pseudomonadota bacterium]MBU0966896.1 hypothetical protein [Pseudomonadota bacterium]